MENIHGSPTKPLEGKKFLLPFIAPHPVGGTDAFRFLEPCATNKCFGGPVNRLSLKCVVYPLRKERQCVTIYHNHIRSSNRLTPPMEWKWFYFQRQCHDTPPTNTFWEWPPWIMACARQLDALCAQAIKVGIPKIIQRRWQGACCSRVWCSENGGVGYICIFWILR